MNTNEAKLMNQPIPDSSDTHVNGVPLIELLPEVGVVQTQGLEGSRVLDLVTDSRRVVPGSLFFALEGLQSDGNDFLEEAIKRGAIGVVSRLSHPAIDGKCFGTSQGL